MLTKKLKIIGIAVAVTLLLFSAWQFSIKKNSDQPDEPAPVAQESSEDKNKEPISYSRASFFIVNPIKASIAIPDDWEGKYRIQEKGNAARFYYIEDPEAQVELFIILYYSVAEWEKIKKKKDNQAVEITTHDSTIFVYELSTEELLPHNQISGYTEMRGDILDIISTFKSFCLD